MRVWVDTESGEWGTDIDAVYTVKLHDRVLTDEQLLMLFDKLSDSERVIFAKAFGHPLRMLGCKGKGELDEDAHASEA